MKYTAEEIKKFKRLNMSADQFLALVCRFEPNTKLTKEDIRRLEHGAFLAVHDAGTGTPRRIHLQSIFMRTFELKYRTTKTKDGKSRPGKEIIISNMPLPRGPIV